MSITKVKAYGRDRYLVRYRDVNSRKKQSKTFDTKREADDFELALRAAKRGGIRVKRQSTEPLSAFWATYLADFAIPDLAAATVASHKAAWSRWIQPELGHVQLATLASTPELVQGLKLKMIRAGAGPATQRRVLAVLSAVLTKAVQLGRIASNPVTMIKKPTAKRTRRVSPLPADEVDALIGQFKTATDRRLVALIAYAGLRPGEALALEDCDVGDKAISISKALKLDGVGATKTNGARVVPISDELRPHLDGRPSGKLFPDQSGKYWSPSKFRNWRTRQWQPAAVKAGLGVITESDGKRSYKGARPYDLRHVAASTWLYNGADPVRVAQWLGHSPAVLFSTYSHVLAETAPS